MSLTLIHLASIPVTNTGVNPARSTSQAIFPGGEYIGRLWLFWVAPIIGAVSARASSGTFSAATRMPLSRPRKRPPRAADAGLCAPAGGKRPDVHTTP